MHIVLALLGTVVSILILLNRLAEAGIDLGGFNPFLHRRRKRWEKQLEGNPIYRVDNPLDLTALLATATVKLDGDMSSKEKRGLLELFQKEFKLSKRESADLLLASVYLMGKPEEIQNSLEKIIGPALESFTPAQAISALNLLDAVCGIDEQQKELKLEFVERIRRVFKKHLEPAGKWG